MAEIKVMTAQHRGGLDEMLKTENSLELDVAKKLIQSGIYEYYGYDERIGAHRYILHHMEFNIGLPTWINVYGEKL